jgi:DNA-binding NarL/FixJ family response regulator
MSGIDCLRRLKRINPPLLCHVLMLTDHEDSDLVFESLQAGASGYLSKDRISVRELAVAIRDVMGSGAVMTPNIARTVMRYFEEPTARASGLSSREREVLSSLSQGLMYKEIADKLGIPLDTVRKHLGSIYRKLHVRSRSDAMRHYLQRPR